MSNGAPDTDTTLAALKTAVHAVPLEGLPRLIGDLHCLVAIADLRLRTGTQPQPTAQTVGETRYLTVLEVVERFHVPRKWLYANKGKMPHSQPSRKRLIFPEQAVTKWFASRRGA